MDDEFATKEDLEAINNNPALLKVYNAMKAGVTKKFQEFSSTNKTLTDTNAKLGEQLGVYEETLKQWEEWRPVIESYDPSSTNSNPNPDNNNGNGGNGNKSRRNKGNGDDGYDFDSLKTQFIPRDEVRSVVETYDKRMGTMQRMLELSLQLDDLYRSHQSKYPNISFDREKVLGAAMEKGYSNLKDAYDSVYREDFIKRDVDTQVNARLEEERAKLRAPGDTGNGSVSMTFKPPESSPKTFNEASDSVLAEIKAGTLTEKTK
jgi:hypothetical protein